MKPISILAPAILAAITYTPYVGATTNREIFSRPVLSRGYEQNQWVLRNSNGSGLRETAQAVGQALAGLQPSYVSGLIYLRSTTELNNTMVDNWNTIRSAVRAARPDARFDVELNLDPSSSESQPFASADALTTKMKQVNARLKPDGWWFDFYSTAQSVHPDWIVAAAAYAHAHNQTIGGNVFDSEVPPGSDAVAFVDKPAPNSTFGFDFNRTQVANLKSRANNTVIIGHLQSNAQNGLTTESCVYIQQWTEAKRLSYLHYWASQQCSVGFTFMWPVFYPLCPGAYAYDPVTDLGVNHTSLYHRIQKMILAPQSC